MTKNKQPTTFNDHYILCNGINTRYWRAGEGKDILILVHGLGGSIDFWHSQVKALSTYYTVYALDMVGFGRTEKPDVDYGYRYFAQFLRSFFDVMGIHRASLVGHSLGGGICLQFAVYYPEKVHHLVLVASGGLSREFTLSLRILTLPFIGEALFKMSLKKPESIIEGLFYKKSGAPEELVRVFSEIYAKPDARHAFLKTLRNNATLFNGTKESISDIVPHLSGITARTLVIWGRQDRVIPFHVAKIPLQFIPQAELWALDGCGHVPFFDRPQLFNKRVKEFLSARE